jgi:hypothetical protein
MADNKEEGPSLRLLSGVPGATKHGKKLCGVIATPKSQTAPCRTGKSPPLVDAAMGGKRTFLAEGAGDEAPTRHIREQ